MDGQHQYEITLKKDDLFINLSSDDVYFISKQMDKWFRILLDDSYVPVTLPQRPEPVLQRPESLIAEPAAAPQPAPEVAQAPQPQPEPVPPVAEVPVAPPAPEPKPEPVAPPQPPVVDLPMAQAPAKPAPPPAPEVAPVAPLVEPQPASQLVAAAIPQPAVVSEAVSDDFEAVMDTLMKDLESAPEAAEPVYAPSGSNGAAAAAAEITQVNSADHHGAASNGPAAPVGEIEMDSHGEPDLAFITSLADLCDRSNASNSEDYLLLSAYFLTRVEHQTAFSLKKVNSVLVKSGLTPINHSVLESVLSRGYLAMVPDLTGTAEVSEYSITPDGQQAAMQLL